MNIKNLTVSLLVAFGALIVHKSISGEKEPVPSSGISPTPSVNDQPQSESPVFSIFV